MRLLNSEQIQDCDIVRTFRHSPIGPLILCAVITAPLAAMIWKWEYVAQQAARLPWAAWLVVAPVTLIVAVIYWLCMSASRAVLSASLLSSNWLLKTSRDGIYLQLRSFQNHHFTLDVPTVAFLSYSEIASACRANENFETGRRGELTQTRKRWLELTLAGVDTEPISAWLMAERTRPVPMMRTLGISSSARFQHTPVIVPRPGMVYVEWLGNGMLRTLAAHVSTAASKQITRDAHKVLPFEARLEQLVARGEPLAAMALAQTERNLSLNDAHSLVESVRTGKPAESSR